MREPPGFDPIGELVEMLPDPLARHRRFGAGGEMNDARARRQLDDAGNRGILRACEDVDADTHPRELAGHLADVNVHPARFLGAERGQRARVHAQHRDPETHPAVLLDTRTVYTGSGFGPNSYL
jgi:hypothetical protein